MELKEKNPAENTKPPVSSIVLYVAFSVTALLALASLINTIIIYGDNVAHYVKMGYPAAEVIKQLVRTQLLPGIFESIAITGGIAIILLGAGIINHKISKCLILLNKNEVSNEAAEELVLEENMPAEGTDFTTLEETTEGNNEDNQDKKDEEDNLKQ